MDQENQVSNSSFPSPSVLAPSSVEPPKPLRKFPLSWILGILAAFLLATTAFLGYQNKQLRSQISSLAKPAPSVSPTPVPGQTSTIPSDWAFKKGATCNVEVPIPPKQEPYYIPEDPKTPPAVDDEGAFWQFREGQNKLFMFENLVRAIFTQPDAASDYIPALVDVYCSPNSDRLDTPQLNYQLDTYLIERASGDSDTTISLKSTKDFQKWGKGVKEITLTGEMFSSEQKYYLLATPSHIYLITKIAQSPSLFVKETADKIFENLKFLE